MKESTRKENGSAGQEVQGAGGYLASRASEGNDAAIRAGETVNYLEVMENYLDVSRQNLEVMEKYLEVLRQNLEVMEKYLEVLRQNLEVMEKYLEVLRQNLEVMEKYLEVLTRNLEAFCPVFTPLDGFNRLSCMHFYTPRESARHEIDVSFKS